MKVTEKIKERVLALLMIPTVIFVSIGSLIMEWWEMYMDGQVTTYSIWERVSCLYNSDNRYICIQSESDNTGWINFTRVMLVASMFLVYSSFLLQLFYQCTDKKTLKVLAIATCATTGILTMLTNFVLIGAYYMISQAWLTLISRSSLPAGTLWFRTLPMGLLFLGSFLSSVIAILLTVNTEHKSKHDMKQITPVFVEKEPVRMRRNIF